MTYNMWFIMNVQNLIEVFHYYLKYYIALEGRIYFTYARILYNHQEKTVEAK